MNAADHGSVQAGAPDFIKKLREVEASIARTDHKRLQILRTTETKVESVLQENWDEIAKAHGISEMVARRMFYHSRFQKELKEQIGLSIIPSASGIFQQVVGAYLRAFLKSEGPFQVSLDRLYEKRFRPDIAVERNGQRWAVIEVKTDLGWHRDYAKSGNCIYGRNTHWDTRFC